MSYEPNQEEIKSVSTLPGNERYQYLVSRIADWEEVWSVAKGNGWAIMCDDHRLELIPMWPSRAFASACCCNEWQDYAPRAIKLDTWLQKWLPGFSQEGRSIAVFPLPDDQGIIVSPDKLKSDLLEEIQQYE